MAALNDTQTKQSAVEVHALSAIFAIQAGVMVTSITQSQSSAVDALEKCADSMHKSGTCA